ncbi:hypothetical protein KFU94_24860 [Chloroflexi bacterium TSY]|nr:hypothetical protein [Chloroflexi bacterium TSY]
MPDKLHLQLFGTLQFNWQGKPITGFVSNKARALLIYLAVTGLVHSRDSLAQLLWADTPTSTKGNLRKALHNLRKLPGVSLREPEPHLVHLESERCWVDVNEFERLACVAPHDLDTLERRAQLYQGDFLTGFNISVSYEFEAWALSERAKLKAQMMELLRQLAEGYAQCGELPQAIATMRQLLQLEPWREEAHRHLMELLAHNGDRSAALKQYTLCQQTLMAEFGIETLSEATEQLYKRILNDEFEPVLVPVSVISTPQSPIEHALLPIEDIPAPSALPAGSIMPLSKNPLFVGREQDLRSLAQTLNFSDAAAVSQVETAATTGLGGIGKTQLACEFVHRYGQFFSGGVFWLSFDNADSIPAEIAACGGVGALDLRPNFGQYSLNEQARLVQAAWREPIPRLLIFDNCEQLELLTRWRPTSGGCRIIVTSRRGDWEPTLGVKMLALGVLSRAESLSLLLSHCPGADEEIVDAIAEELGDLPLALHLAGSHLRRYPRIAPAVYLEQLRDPQLLHHSSMQGEGFSPTGHIQHVGRTFALSYDRLNPQNETDARAIKLLVHAAHFAPGEPNLVSAAGQDSGAGFG